MLLPLAIASCGGDDKDEPQSTVNDPEGTVTANLMNTFQFIGREYYNGITLDLISPSGPYDFGLNSSNNLEVSYPGLIASVGKVEGLSSIIKLPESGWAEQVAAMPGYGYIVKSTYWNGVDYAIIYVIDYIKDNSGSITGVKIKYKIHYTLSN